MKLGGSRLRLGAAALVLSGGVAVVAAPNIASAHQNESYANCDGIHGRAWIYDEIDTNAMTIYLDGAAVYSNPDFGTGHEHSVPVPQDGETHTWKVVIDSSNDQWDSQKEGSVGPCGESTTTTQAPRTVQICHRDQGKPEWKVIEISESALDSHLSHQWGEDIYPVPANGCPPPPPTEIQPPTLSTTYDCVSDGPATGVLSPATGNWTTSGDLDPSKLVVRIDVTANDGYTFPGDQLTKSLTATAVEDDDCEVAPVTPTLKTNPECGVLDTYTIPTTAGVAYLVNDVVAAANTYDLAPGTSVTITAKAADGYRLTTTLEVTLTGGPDTTCTTATTEPPTTTERPTTTTQPPATTEPPTTTPVGLDISAMAPACFNDAPYIEITFGDQAEFNGRTATVTFIDLDGNVVGTETATYQAGATVRFVYPGASVDAAGNPVDWPGWMFDGDEWVHDPSDAHLRDGLTVVVEVNPTATGSVTYPDATSACADPEVVPAPTTTTPAPAGELPQTGSPSGLIAAIAGALVLAGGATMMSVRRTATKR